MPVEARRSLLLIAAICLLFAIAGWVLYGALFRFAPAQDFMVFYTAVRSCIEGHLSLIFDGDAFTAAMNEQFRAWLAAPLNLHPWVYPPLFLLLMVPFGMLPFAVSCGFFLIVTFVLLNCAVRCYAPRSDQRLVCGVSLLLSPATAFTVAVGQNAFMTSALLVGGFGLMRRTPLLAGTLLGLLACKPQLWLLVPVALLAAREWQVLASALGVACLLALTSAAVFGLEPWREWLMLMLRPNPLYEHWLQFGRLNGQSAYTEAVLLGAPPGFASLLQAVATLACAALVWWCFRLSGLGRDLQLAVLLTATILAAPHVSNYDAVMVAVAVSLFLCRVLDDGLRIGDAILIIAVWSIELLNPPQVFRCGLVTPLVYCLFLVALIARGRSQRGLARRPDAHGAPCVDPTETPRSKVPATLTPLTDLVSFRVRWLAPGWLHRC
jgi:alpha-1,2-mannosyltransferase